MISPPRRPARAGEWTKGAAIMFVVTLAATGSVTLAARAAGMSRKSAYALKKRDPLFAAAWRAAKEAAPRPADRPAEGDNSPRAAPSTSTIGSNRRPHQLTHPDYVPAWRNRLFAELRLDRESTQAARLAALARRAPPQ